MELDDNQHLVDWSHEREWRKKDDLEFGYDDIEVIVPDNRFYRKFIEYCIENNQENLKK